MKNFVPEHMLTIPVDIVVGQDSEQKGLRLIHLRWDVECKGWQWIGEFGGETHTPMFLYGYEELRRNNWEFVDYLHRT